MNEQREQVVCETAPSRVRRDRFLFWIVNGMLAAFFVTMLWAVPRAVMAFFLSACFGIIMLNGFRTVIGVAVRQNGLTITTPFTQEEFPWTDVRVTGHWLLRIDLHIGGKLWPYMWVPWSRKNREALRTIKLYSGRSGTQV
jgi:hypothetical protein